MGGRLPTRSTSTFHRAGDSDLRCLLVGSAHYILGPLGPDTDLRRWELALAKGKKNAKERAVVAVARKLAVLTADGRVVAQRTGDVANTGVEVYRAERVGRRQGVLRAPEFAVGCGFVGAESSPMIQCLKRLQTPMQVDYDFERFHMRKRLAAVVEPASRSGSKGRNSAGPGRSHGCRARHMRSGDPT